MKILPTKTFPHPVLWGNADDYVRRQFQATLQFEVMDDYVPVLSFNFTINEEDITKLLRENNATYSVEVYCSTTCVRRTFCTNKVSDEFSLNRGDLYGRVEINAFVICTEPVNNYSSRNFNKEFGNATFDLQPGDVLAAAGTEVYFWDTELSKPLLTVFTLEANTNIDHGMFEIDTSGEKVKIQMRPEDKERFEQLRSARDTRPTALFAYLPVVVEVLQQMKDDESGEHDGKKWCRAIDYQIDKLGKKLASSDPFKLAQELLKKPLAHLLSTIN